MFCLFIIFFLSWDQFNPTKSVYTACWKLFFYFIKFACFIVSIFVGEPAIDHFLNNLYNRRKDNFNSNFLEHFAQNIGYFTFFTHLKVSSLLIGDSFSLFMCFECTIPWPSWCLRPPLALFVLFQYLSDTG